MKNLFPFLVFFSLLFITCGTEISSSALPLSVVENVSVDFEPNLNLVQTIPYHIEKQNSNAAYISAKLEKYPDLWILKYWSSEVEILDFVALNDCSSAFNAQYSNDTLIVSFSDVAEIQNELETQEQLIGVLNVELWDI